MGAGVALRTIRKNGSKRAYFDAAEVLDALLRVCKTSNRHYAARAREYAARYLVGDEARRRYIERFLSSNVSLEAQAETASLAVATY